MFGTEIMTFGTGNLTFGTGNLRFSTESLRACTESFAISTGILLGSTEKPIAITKSNTIPEGCKVHLLVNE
jgi:hypothetical protein